MSTIAGLSEEDAERLAPPPAAAAKLAGKADAAWDEASDFPDLAESQAANKPASKRNPPVIPPPPVPKPAIEAAPLVIDTNDSGADLPVRFIYCLLCMQSLAVLHYLVRVLSF